MAVDEVTGLFGVVATGFGDIVGFGDITGFWEVTGFGEMFTGLGDRRGCGVIVGGGGTGFSSKNILFVIFNRQIMKGQSI